MADDKLHKRLAAATKKADAQLRKRVRLAELKERGQALKPGQEVEGYEIMDRCGQGGISELVYAFHIESWEMRVIKYPRPGFSELVGKALTDSFRREADLLHKLDHPNIVKGYQPFKHHGLIHIPMEILNKGLRYLFAERVSLDSLLQFMQQATSALGYLHEKGKVHCDVKPYNFMLNSENVVKLTDFGSVRDIGESLQDMIVTENFYPAHAGLRFAEPSIDLYGFGKTILRLVGLTEKDILELAAEESEERRNDLLTHKRLPFYLINNIALPCMRSVEKDRDFSMEDLEKAIATFEEWIVSTPILVTKDLYTGETLDVRRLEPTSEVVYMDGKAYKLPLFPSDLS